MEAVRSSETSVYFKKTTRRYTIYGCHLQHFILSYKNVTIFQELKDITLWKYLYSLLHYFWIWVTNFSTAAYRLLYILPTGFTTRYNVVLAQWLLFLTLLTLLNDDPTWKCVKNVCRMKYLWVMLSIYFLRIAISPNTKVDTLINYVSFFTKRR
jgi:hypothetical protein